MKDMEGQVTPEDKPPLNRGVVQSNLSVAGRTPEKAKPAMSQDTGAKVSAEPCQGKGAPTPFSQDTGAEASAEPCQGDSTPAPMVDVSSFQAGCDVF